MSTPNIEYQNSLRTDGGPWASLVHVDPRGIPVENANQAYAVDVLYSDVGPDGEASLGDDHWLHVMTIRAAEIEVRLVHRRYGHKSYGEPMFAHIRRLIIARRVDAPYALPETIEELDDLLELLPTGFYKNWRHGLGVRWEYRAVLAAIDAIPGVHDVHFHGPNQPPPSDHIGPSVYVLSMVTFRRLQSELRRISQRHQREALKEKQALTHNVLLHRLEPDKFEQRKVKVASGTLSQITYSSGRADISRSDQRAAIKLVQQNAASLSKAAPADLLRLKEDIEVVTLLELIEKCEKLLTPPASEHRWQSFLSANPFVLTMAFHYPVVMIDSVPYVGGKAHHGEGGKFGDFLMAAAATNNLAIVEIKSPGVDLLGTKYREGVWPPSRELAGAVAQVLAQRDTFIESFPLVGRQLDRSGYRAYSLACVVVAGRTPHEEEARQSFERYRSSLHGATLVTFDELVERLRSIYRLLTQPVPLPRVPGAPWSREGQSDGEIGFGSDLF